MKAKTLTVALKNIESDYIESIYVYRGGDMLCGARVDKYFNLTNGRRPTNDFLSDSYFEKFPARIWAVVSNVKPMLDKQFLTIYPNTSYNSRASWSGLVLKAGGNTTESLYYQAEEWLERHFPASDCNQVYVWIELEQ